MFSEYISTPDMFWPSNLCKRLWGEPVTLCRAKLFSVTLCRAKLFSVTLCRAKLFSGVAGMLGMLGTLGTLGGVVAKASSMIRERQQRGHEASDVDETRSFLTFWASDVKATVAIQWLYSGYTVAMTKADCIHQHVFCIYNVHNILWFLPGTKSYCEVSFVLSCKIKTGLEVGVYSWKPVSFTCMT